MWGGGGGGSTNSVEDRENGILEAVVIWYKKCHFISKIS